MNTDQKPKQGWPKNHQSAVIAFSGGLDTSMLVPYMREQYGLKEVVTCVVDTGGMSAADRSAVERRSKELGADDHVCLDASQAFYDEVIKFLIFGQVSRDGYPLCVGAERLIQARETIRLARERGIGLVGHGCTGAGNDQYRFDLVAHVLGEGIDTAAPVREQGLKREFSQNFLRERGFAVPEKSKYSYNAGLWGVSIGGAETHASEGLIPEEAWYAKPDPDCEALTALVCFEKGEPLWTRIGEGQDAEAARAAPEVGGPLAVIRALAAAGNRLGVGRHYHTGTSIPGKKGRIAYESPAADILYDAHRTLEKHVLMQSQIFFKQGVANEFGRLIHEARFFDPLLENLKAFLASTQERVSGVCTVHLRKGYIACTTVNSPYDLLGGDGSVYGEYADYYDARDAQGACRLHAYEQLLHRRAGGKNS